MKYQLGRCHGLILEANHDPAMLRNGPYPAQLKQRVLSNLGDVANEDAAAFVRNLESGPLQALILAHVSETNNHPDHIQGAFSDCGPIDNGKARLVLASQNQPSPLIDLNSP
jgi:phosphoribosyl 1,2-cyclic phosphodiesterase